MKGYSKIRGSIIAAAGAVIYSVGLYLSYLNFLLPFLVAVITVPMIENNLVVDIVRECKVQKRFAWREQNVRKDLQCILLTLFFTWIILFLTLRVKFK